MYMCGTKCDLAERADDVRVIETDAATAYANGKCAVLFIVVLFLPVLSRNVR